MLVERRSDIGSLDNQANFAQRLVDALGYDAAIKECYENQWLGILHYLQDHKEVMH